MPLEMESGVVLQRRLTALSVPLGPAERAVLRELVRAFAYEARHAREWNPEQMLIALKWLASQGGLRPASRNSTTPSERERLYSELIGWAIEAFYGLDHQ